MKDQIIHTIVISIAILGAGFVIGTIIKDKPQQVVAEVKPEVKPEVKSTDIVINDQLKELIIANERQENELAYKDKEIGRLRSGNAAVINNLNIYKSRVSQLNNAGRNNERLLTVYTKIVQEMRSLRNMAGKDYHIHRRINEIAIENDELLKEGEKKVRFRDMTHAGPAHNPDRKISITEKTKVMSPENRIKYVENKMLLASLIFSLKNESIEKAFKPLIPQFKGLPPAPNFNSDGTVVMPKNSIEDMLKRAIPPASNKPVHIDPLTGQPIPLKPSVVMPRAGSGILTPEK